MECVWDGVGVRWSGCGMEWLWDGVGVGWNGYGMEWVWDGMVWHGACEIECVWRGVYMGRIV